MLRQIPLPEEAPQNMLEYDPEWGRAFYTSMGVLTWDNM